MDAKPVDSHPVLRARQARHGTTGEPLGRYCWLWCPGCDEVHSFVTTNEDGTTPSGPVWTWDGHMESPTFSPSLLVRGPSTVCHSFVRDGRWEFLTDCTHTLAGKTVPLAPLPDWLI